MHSLRPVYDQTSSAVIFELPFTRLCHHTKLDGVGRTGEHRFDEVLEGRLARLPEVEADGRECRAPDPEGTLLIDARFKTPPSGAFGLCESSSLADAFLSLVSVMSRR